MPYNPDIHHRRSIRLKDYDYSQEGAYFITICTYQRECVFGKVENGVVVLSEIGEIVRGCWLDIEKHYPMAHLDESVIMPNHLHGNIFIIPQEGEAFAPYICEKPVDHQANASPLPMTPCGTKPGSIASMIQNFKSVATRRVNKLATRGQGIPLWQRDYYEHIIRSERELDAKRKYIAENPIKWELDEDHPANW